mmetsp:Transcript_5806/g.13810  ORF Transcript_5806/g.13810 Transcript_5806/m.13810 type:complete len:990 (-) Transcript_5806:90-3059(-)
MQAFTTVDAGFVHPTRPDNFLQPQSLKPGGASHASRDLLSTTHLAGAAWAATAASVCLVAVGHFVRRARRHRDDARFLVKRSRLTRCAMEKTSGELAVSVADEDEMLSPIILDLPMVVNTFDETAEARAANVIQHRLQMDTTYQAALQLVDRHLDRFSLINKVSALVICAREARDSAELDKRLIKHDPNFVLLFKRIKEEVLQNASTIKPRTLGDILWSSAHLNIFDNLLSEKILEDAKDRLDEYSSPDISYLLFAAGKLGIQPGSLFMQALSREIGRRGYSGFAPNAISMVVYGLARIGLIDRRVLDKTALYIMKCDEEMLDQAAVCTLMYGFAKLDYFDVNLFGKLSRRLVDLKSSLTGRQINMATLACSLTVAKLQEAVYVLEELGRAVSERIDEFDDRFISQYALAMGRAALVQREQGMGNRMQDMPSDNQDPIPNAIIDSVIGKRVLMDRGSQGRAGSSRELKNFALSELNLITYGLMRMQCRNEDYLQRTCLLFSRRAAELTDIELVNVLYAHAKLQFVHIEMIHALLEEIQRRDMLKTFDPLQVATVAYSMALYRLRSDWLFDGIVTQMCNNISEYTAQQISMVCWSCAVLNFRPHAEVLASISIEAMVEKWSTGDANLRNFMLTLWACTVLAGKSCGLWLLEAILSYRFMDYMTDETELSMLHQILATLHAELGIATEEMRGAETALKCYQETTDRIGRQNDDLSRLLNLKDISHKKNFMVPALPGRVAPLVRGDIIVEKLRLIAEVEGPKRWTLPLDKTYELDRNLMGAPEQVYQEVVHIDKDNRSPDEDDENPKNTIFWATGSAVWKRRILRQCGWKAVSLSFVDQEELFASALQTYFQKEEARERREDSKQPEETLDDSKQLTLRDPDEDIDPFGDVDYPADDEDGFREAIPEYTEPPRVRQESTSPMSAYERDLRAAHKRAMEELSQRLEEERGNVAYDGYDGVESYMDFREWQVKVEIAVLKEMLEELPMPGTASE